MKLNKITLAVSLLTALTSSVSWANTGCYSNDNDGSVWLEKTVNFSPEMVINYNSSNWDKINHVMLDFEHDKIDNPRSVSVTVNLKNSITEKQSILGILENSNSSNGSSVRAGSTSLRMNLNSQIYYDDLKDGVMNLGIGRTGSNETLEITSIVTKFCGVVVDDGNTITVDANTNNLASNSGAAKIHYIDSDTTYRLTTSGEAIDEEDNQIDSVSIQYIDPRDKKSITKQLKPGQENYIHTDGTVSLFYVLNGSNNQGKYKVNFKRVNLD